MYGWGPVQRFGPWLPYGIPTSRIALVNLQRQKCTPESSGLFQHCFASVTIGCLADAFGRWLAQRPPGQATFPVLVSSVIESVHDRRRASKSSANATFRRRSKARP
jgi:hypothetical protein